jgi:hypothetical protein
MTGAFTTPLRGLFILGLDIGLGIGLDVGLVRTTSSPERLILKPTWRSIPLSASTFDSVDLAVLNLLLAQLSASPTR